MDVVILPQTIGLALVGRVTRRQADPKKPTLVA
jgi:hypothetical protein